MGLWPANRPPPLTEHLGRVEQLQQTAPALGLVGGKPPIGVSHAQQLEPEATHPEPRVDPQAVAPSFAAALRATGRGGRREQVSTMDHGPRCLVGLQLPSATCAEETGGGGTPHREALSGRLRRGLLSGSLWRLPVARRARSGQAGRARENTGLQPPP